ncbi:hypothetical protein OG21DRAFT_1414673 [Imleria badia]|nr:hypothetical protein OG21DRAFT_1414673 [Imleria badia]
MLQLHAGRKVGSFQADCQLSVNQDLASRFADRDLLIFGVRLIHRFERFGALADLQQAIILLRILVRSTSASSNRYREGLVNLGMALRYRFNHVGELSDLEEAISKNRNAIDLTPHGHPDRPLIDGNLGNSLATRFNYLGEPRDLEEAISRHRDAVDLTPHGHPDKPMCLSNLGGSLLTRFGRFGELSDFEEAILRFRDAVNLSPHGDPEKPSRLNNLARSLVTRFERLGEMGDLEDAISMLRVAVNLTPHGYIHKPSFLASLGNSLKARFQYLGELSDLEEGISRYRDAIDLIPHGHPYKLTYLGNLGNSFFTRFKHLGDPGDLEEAISRFRDAVDFTPHGHPHKPDRLNDLSNSLKARFRCFGELSDLEHAISMLKDALNLTSHDDACKPSYLNSLGNSLKARFEFFGEPSDLEDAISMLGDAIDLIPCGHSYKPHFLNNLGNAFLIRFERLGELSDLEDAISRYRDAVDLAPHGRLERSYYLYNLGISLDARFERLGQPNDPEEAISLFLLAVSASISPIRVRLYASQSWISCARRIRHHTLLHSYSVYINLLHQHAWIGLPFALRCSRLIRVADVVREAAAAALDSGLPETAVEWLEQGRSIVWGELFQLRSSHEELSSAHPDHAHRLRELSAALDHASVNHEKAWPSPSEQNQSAAHHVTQTLKQAMADRHRMLAIKRDKLLQEIRSFPGFEQFLLRKEFSQLRASAHSGPVVMLNAAESRCDALIILANVDHVIHVPLPKFPFKRAAGLQKMLDKLLGHARAVLCNDRKGDPATRYCISWESLLSNLWNDVVIPVLDALAFSVSGVTPEELSRIFWCPTGPFVFLPIHAAGIYGTQHSKPGHKVSDFVISSYVPTLSSLMLSLDPGVAPSGDLRLLAIRQPPSDGLSQLPGVATELEHIKAVIRNSPSARTTLLESSVGTVEEVLSLMKGADWVHFACHGIQDDVDSGLCLADRRRLKLRDIIALSRPHGGLAFLSACQTATGDKRLSDEAIHIAAGMLFAGYGGIIGTMWSINDKLAPEVARDVYEQLFRNGTRPDYREAARALHEAIRRLRDSGQASFITWLPFIHVGL